LRKTTTTNKEEAVTKLQKFLKEPLVHFLVLASLLFVAEYLFSAQQKERIVIDQQSIDYLIKQRSDLELRELSAAEKQETIESYIDDEILLREAYKRGLNNNDSRMRRNMILKMRGLLQGEVQEPTEEDLRAFYQNNPEQFQQLALFSMYQVFYSEPGNVPDGLLDSLREGADISELGESFMMYGRVMRRVSQPQLVGMLGPDAAKAILAIDDQQWHGPIESTRGVHYVQVLEKVPARTVGYEETQSYLKSLFTMSRAREAVVKKAAELRQDYEIIVEWDKPVGP